MSKVNTNPLTLKLKSQKAINLTFNAYPDTVQIKVIREGPTESRPIETMDGVSVIKSTSPIHFLERPASAMDNIEDEEKRVRHNLEQKGQHLRDFKRLLSARLQKSASMRKIAIQEVLANVEAESIEHHAGYLKPPKVKVKDKVDKKMVKQLSADDLDLNNLPTERSYLLYPEENYTFQKKWYGTDDFGLETVSANRTSETSMPQDAAEREKELRLCYRAGHLDEIKKMVFGKVYSATRKHFMDVERHELLKKHSTKAIVIPKPSKSSVKPSKLPRPISAPPVRVVSKPKTKQRTDSGFTRIPRIPRKKKSKIPSSNSLDSNPDTSKTEPKALPSKPKLKAKKKANILKG